MNSKNVDNMDGKFYQFNLKLFSANLDLESIYNYWKGVLLLWILKLLLWKYKYLFLFCFIIKLQ